MDIGGHVPPLLVSFTFHGSLSLSAFQANLISAL